MRGAVGVVRGRLDPEGLVFVHGELWQAYTDDGPIEPGEEVEVERIDGLRLEVRRAEPATSTEPVGAGSAADSA
jgi:membrane-bound serine protease (ClpP class)